MIKEKRICVFGDSGVSEELNWGYPNWVSIFRNYISNQNKANSVFGLGISGETSKGLLKRIEVEAKARNPNIIIIQIGDNDACITNHKIETLENKFKSNIAQIIKVAKNNAPVIIFIGSHPCNEDLTTPTVWSKYEYFYNQNLKKYSEIIKSICGAQKVNYIPFFDDVNNLNYKSYLSKEDGLHLNKKGNEYFAKKIINFGVVKKLW